MVFFARSMRELSFSKLMEIYIEGNRENGQEFYPEEPEGRQLQLAEERFYHYLREDFFPTAGAVYGILEENGEYISALRLEPYQDGLLLEGLETAPRHRRKGFGKKLMLEVLAQFPGEKIYSHVGKTNTPSLMLHESCGFQPVLEYSVYIDGSVNSFCRTLCHNGEL